MTITNELLAAYTEGNVSQEEREAVRKYLAANPDIMESVIFAMDYDTDSFAHEDNKYMDNLCTILDDIEAEKSAPSPLTINRNIIESLPMTAMAAQNNIDNQCVIRCEGIAIRHFGINVTDEELLKESKAEGWLKPEGTALHNIGRLSGSRGLFVSHRYHCTIEDIREALSANEIIIAAIDCNELTCDYVFEQQKDVEIGQTPNHVVIITNIVYDKITICDSATPNKEDIYPLSQFLDAWNDSSNYLILISNNKEYIPHPINLNDVDVEDELLELREAIAENAHEVWAETRRNEGWTYGPVRNDAKKQHPDMLPYNLLPESEKEYDRIMAMNTIKLVKKLGWEFLKKKK